MDFLLDDLVVDLAFNPDQPRDADGRWTKANVSAAINRFTETLAAKVALDGGPDQAVMPQLSGVPIAGSKADALPHAPGGEVDLVDQFEKELRGLGVVVGDTEIPVSDLKPTQNGVIPEKVEGLATYMLTAPEDSPVWEPIFVTRDNYVVDGHHRWAARTVKDEVLGKGPTMMKARKIELDQADALLIANRFMDEWGLPKATMADKSGPVAKFDKPTAPAVRTNREGEVYKGERYRGSVLKAQPYETGHAGGYWARKGTKSSDGTGRILPMGSRKFFATRAEAVAFLTGTKTDLSTVDLEDVIDLADYSSLARPGYTGPRRTSDKERAIAHALIRKGMKKSKAIRMARGLLKKAAASGRWGDHGKASAKTRAAAAASIAQRKTF